MGILNCDRRWCENIMCDFYSSTYGYICKECLEELKNKPYVLISEFMDSPKEDNFSKGERLKMVNNVFQRR